MEEFKVQKSFKGSGSSFAKYRELVLGTNSLWYFLKYELVMLLSSSVPGALGLFLRKKLYPLILGKVGKGVIFGRNVSFRHPLKIHIGDNVIVDDNTMVDAKGSKNSGIRIGNNVYIGRNCIIYCKDGDIILKDRVNIGHNSVLFSSNKLVIEDEVLIAAYFYAMSGGEYKYDSDVKIIDQSGFSRGETVIGNNCWFGTKVVVADGVKVGKYSVIGANSLVIKDIPEYSVAVGSPAKVIKRVEVK